MNLSHPYASPPPAEDARRLLLEAFDLGVRHADTAALYRFGRNEELVGPSAGLILNRTTGSGARYAAAVQTQIDTEEF
jgi:hypothetical protein